MPFLATPKGTIERNMLALMKLDVTSGVAITVRLLVYYDFAAHIKTCEAARRGEPRSRPTSATCCDLAPTNRGIAWFPT